MKRNVLVPSLILVFAFLVGAGLNIVMKLGVLEASLAGVSAFFTLAFFSIMVQSKQENTLDPEQAVREMRASVEGLRMELGELRDSVGHLRKNFAERADAEARMTAELRIVETLIKQLAEVVARVEVQAASPRLALSQMPSHPIEQAREAQNMGSETAQPSRHEENNAQAFEKDAGAEEIVHSSGFTDLTAKRDEEDDIKPIKRTGTGRYQHLSDVEMLRIVRNSVQSNRVDLYLQPVVTLPQRKVRYYEALTRLRQENGDVILPADYMPVAEPAGVMPLIDNILLFRCVQVIKRLSSRNREAGVFCNISFHSLIDSEFFADFTAYLRQNQELSRAIIFEFGQSTFESIGPAEEESLRELSKMGFRFSMDKVRNLKINPQRLIERGFKFVKIPADMLMDTDEDMDIHPIDLAPMMARHNIELIVERVETEAAVVDLLDYNITLGQGFLFSAPRPVRADVLGEKEQSSTAAAL